MGEQDNKKHEAAPPGTRWTRAHQLAAGMIFGFCFGFLLQKGGVAKFHVLIGQLLLEDFTVIKVMLTAVVTGMIGIFAMQAKGLVTLHPKPTRYGANIIGGLFFGAGFALAAYCPGTGAAALGQGNLDALAVMAGLMAGSYLFAEISGWLGRTVERWGDRGELLLPDLLRVKRGPFVVGFSVLLIAVLLLIGRMTS